MATRYEYLRARERVAARRAFREGVAVAAGVFMADASVAFEAEDDKEARRLRAFSKKIRALQETVDDHYAAPEYDLICNALAVLQANDDEGIVPEDGD